MATILHMRANGVQSKSNGPSYQMPNPLMGDAGSGTGVGGDTGGDTSGDIDAVFRSHANNEVRLSGAMHWCHSCRLFRVQRSFGYYILCKRISI